MSDERGVRCPYCNCGMSEVVRTTNAFGKKRRTRVCRHCRRKFFTSEKAESGAKMQKGADLRESD